MFGSTRRRCSRACSSAHHPPRVDSTKARSSRGAACSALRHGYGRDAITSCTFRQGIPHGAAAGVASSPMTALDVLKRGPDTDVVAIAREARDHAGKHAHTVPTMVVQGQQDDVVAPMHASEIVRQTLAFARFAGIEPAPAPLP